MALFCLFPPFLQKYKDVEGMVKMEELKGEELVRRFAEEMEEMLGRKMKSVKVMRAQAEFQQARFNRRNCDRFSTCCVFPEVGRSS